MTDVDDPRQESSDVDTLRDDWLRRLADLVSDVKTWAEDLGWVTREIKKPMEDSEIGRYQAPALLMQKETTRVLLDPVARSAPGAEGVVDLYLMPAYDDIASFYHGPEGWHVHYMFPGTSSVADVQEAERKSLSKETLRDILGEMRENAV